ncbi:MULTISPECIES: hypothetical protein [unclassified Bradyrhizobium]|uniref:hypothetical protein n=1 Tax=unclassified Bradyrhizobium TaxID=2631580 RepID=UPI0033986FFA
MMIGSYSRSYFRGLIDGVWISFGVVLQAFAGLSGAEMSREERSLCCCSRKTAGDRHAQPLGDHRAAESRRHPRVRGARLDKDRADRMRASAPAKWLGKIRRKECRRTKLSLNWWRC